MARLFAALAGSSRKAFGNYDNSLKPGIFKTKTQAMKFACSPLRLVAWQLAIRNLSQISIRSTVYYRTQYPQLACRALPLEDWENLKSRTANISVKGQIFDPLAWFCSCHQTAEASRLRTKI
jgi:hypothetical protein